LYERITTKDIVALNQLFDKGTVVNVGSLEFAVSQANQQKGWLRQLAIMVRAILVDHVFEEGNKRTAFAFITGTLEAQGLVYNRDVVSRCIVNVLKKNVTNITDIERSIKDAIRE